MTRTAADAPSVPRPSRLVPAMAPTAACAWRGPGRPSQSPLSCHRAFLGPFIFTSLFQFCQNHVGFHVTVHHNNILKRSRAVSTALAEGVGSDERR